MGRDSNFTCITCKKTYDLGYGSAISWLDSAKTVAEYDELAAECLREASLLKNLNFRKCLVEHEGHEWECWSFDWCSQRGGNITQDGGYSGDTILVEGYDNYENIDLWNKGDGIE